MTRRSARLDRPEERAAEPPGSLWDGLQRGLGVVGAVLTGAGIGTSDPVLREVGERLTEGARRVPEVREQVKETLPKAGARAGQEAAERLFDWLDGNGRKA